MTLYMYTGEGLYIRYTAKVTRVERIGLERQGKEEF